MKYVISVVGVVLTLFFVNLVTGKQATAADYKILVLGDSLSAGYGLAGSEAFPNQLEARLKAAGSPVTVIGAGVSGDTTSGGLARLDWAMGDNPDLVILELGANDGLRGIDPSLTFENLAQMIKIIQAQGKKVLLAGMLAPPNMGQEYAAQFNRIYPDLAQKYGVTLYPFFLEGVAGVPDLNLEDGIHPTAEGIARIVEGILPVVQQVMEQKQLGRNELCEPQRLTSLLVN